jgi:hypothetical protein
MAATVSRSQALTTASAEVSMHRQGRGWVVSTYDAEAGAWRTSSEHPYPMAMRCRRDAIIRRALVAAGMTPDAAEVACERDGRAADVVREALTSNPTLTAIEIEATRREGALRAAIDALRAARYDTYRTALGGVYIGDMTPDPSDYDGSTEPGSPWDEECDRRLAAVNAIVAPHGCCVEWSDDDLAIEVLV